MKTDNGYFVDVARIWAEQVTKRLGYTVHFVAGHPEEVNMLLNQKDRANVSRFEKYPLIVLFQDFLEQNKFNMPYYEVINPVFLIVNSAKIGENNTKERYTTAFREVLYPIYQTFVDTIYYSPHVSPVQDFDFSFQKIDRLFWDRLGVQEKGFIFSDRLDAIELKISNLKISKKYCYVL
jgi:hypothetical protein